MKSVEELGRELKMYRSRFNVARTDDGRYSAAVRWLTSHYDLMKAKPSMVKVHETEYEEMKGFIDKFK